MAWNTRDCTDHFWMVLNSDGHYSSIQRALFTGECCPGGKDFAPEFPEQRMLEPRWKEDGPMEEVYRLHPQAGLDSRNHTFNHKTVFKWCH